MKILIVSPHCDDAAFSLAEHILTWVEDGHDVEIYTVYGGMPTDAKGRDKHRTLDEEHRKAVAALDVTASRSTHLDDAYMPRPSTADLCETFRYATVGARPDVVVCPTGIGHPDHLAVSFACKQAVFPQRVWVYDEIPYYVRAPRDAFEPYVSPDGGHWPVGCRPNLVRKKEICQLYASQMNEDLLRCLWVPERCWGEL